MDYLWPLLMIYKFRTRGITESEIIIKAFDNMKQYGLILNKNKS